METCVNCACEFDDPYGNNNDEDLKLFNVYQPLSSIYKLNYLSLFLDPSHIENENQVIWKLCENCLGLFTNLQQFYHDFNQLRSLESKLATEIQKLDDCIQANSQQQKQTEQNEETKNKSKRKQDLGVTPQTYHDRIPKIVLTRLGLEADPSPREKLNSTNSPSHSEDRPRILRNRGTKFKSASGPISEPEDSSFILPELLQIELNEHEQEAKQEKELLEGNEIESCDEDPLFFIPTQTSDEDEDLALVKEAKGKVEKKDDDDDSPGKKRREKQQEKGVKMKRKSMSHEYVYKYKRRKLEVPNPCWECARDFPTPKETFSHTMKTHCKKGDYICEDCSKISKTKKAHIHHQKQQCALLKPGEVLPLLSCSKCEAQGKITAFSMKGYKEHLRNVHHEGILECTFPGCDFKTMSRGALHNHTKNIHQEKPDPLEERTCEECKKVFKSKTLFNIHYKSLHTAEGLAKYKERLKRGTEQKREKDKHKPKLYDETFCSECMVDLLTHNALVLHQKQVHGGPKCTFVCEQCGTSFSRRDALQKHKRTVHTDKRNFYCDKCPKSFKTSSGLSTHARATHDEQGRLEYNAKMRLKNQRRKIRNQALAQSLSSGIPQFTGAKFIDPNQNSDADGDVNGEAVNPTNTMD